MSEPENFLARWSRRKLDRETPEPAEPDMPDRARAEAPDDAAAVASESQGESESASPGTSAPERRPPRDETGLPQIDLDSLPSIDSITSATDIRGFLRSGVPLDLQRAALRRMWTADPAIRDYIGLSENAYDFDTMKDLPGFGPLDMTDDLRRLVAEIVGKAMPEPAPGSAVGQVPARGEPEAKSVSDAPSSPSGEAVASPTDTDDRPADSIATDRDNKPEEVASPRQQVADMPHRKTEFVATQQSERHDPGPIGRGHGRALPQ